MGCIVRSSGYMVLHRPVELAGLLGNWPITLFCRDWLLQQEREPLASSNFLVALIEAAVDEGDDPPVGLAAAFPQGNHFSLNPNRVPMKKRLGEADVVPTEIGDRRAERCVSNGNSHHHAQGQATIDERPAILRFLHV